MNKPVDSEIEPRFPSDLRVGENRQPTKEVAFSLLYLRYFDELLGWLELGIHRSIPPLLRSFSQDIANDATIDALIDVAKQISTGTVPKGKRILQLLRTRARCNKFNRYRKLGVPKKLRQSTASQGDDIWEALEATATNGTIEICREFIKRSREFLTAREKEVLDKLLDGETNRQIAEAMGCSEYAIEKVRSRIKSEFDRFWTVNELG